LRGCFTKVTLADTGPSDATDVQVTDLLPAGLTFVNDTPSQGSYDATTGLWTVGTVTTTTPQTLTVMARVVSPNSQTNTANITHSDQFDPDPNNNSASAVRPRSSDRLGLVIRRVPPARIRNESCPGTPLYASQGRAIGLPIPPTPPS
jgi:hypothetical protein